MSVQTHYNWQGSQEAIGLLRARIAKIEGRPAGLSDDGQAKAWTCGLDGLDAALGGGLGLGALHEIAPALPVDLPVASAFALGLLARLKRRGPLFWCMSGMTGTEYGAPYAPGLAMLGIDPARMICVTVRHPKDLSFVLEEAARHSSLAAIIAEGPLPSFTASRRLALLLASSGVPMLFLPDGKALQGSAAATRFRVRPITESETSFDSRSLDPRSLDPHSLDPRSPGPPAFHVTLARNRGGRPGLSFEMVFDHASISFRPPGLAPFSRAQPDSVPNRQFSVESAEQRRAWAS